ncbi:MAG: DUF5689 domain-containing protein, partial [Chitinophagaceae bacterium]|nr:DUF5689 domain-containing protein [Chitinophagaceae bacterium]
MSVRFCYIKVSLLFFFTAVFFIFSCNKKFTDMKQEEINTVPVNYTISELKSLHTKDNIEFLQDDKTIAGTVIANDKSGNFYQSVIIQDETGGIVVRMNDFNLYATFPVGRKIYIKLKGLYLGDYGGVIQIGGGIDNTDSLSSIAPNLVDTYIVKGSFNNEVIP